MSDNGDGDEYSFGSSNIVDLHVDTVPTATDSCSDKVDDDRQQSALKNLRMHLCQEDFAYLCNNTEVNKIATLLLKEMFRVKPDNPYAYAARYLSDSKTKDRLAGFTWSNDRMARDLLDQE